MNGMLYGCFSGHTAPYPTKPHQRIQLSPKKRIAWSRTQVHVVRFLGSFFRGMIKNVQPCCTVQPRLHLTSYPADPCEVLYVVDLLEFGKKKFGQMHGGYPKVNLFQFRMGYLGILMVSHWHSLRWHFLIPNKTSDIYVFLVNMVSLQTTGQTLIHHTCLMSKPMKVIMTMQ